MRRGSSGIGRCNRLQLLHQHQACSTCVVLVCCAAAGKDLQESHLHPRSHSQFQRRCSSAGRNRVHGQPRKALESIQPFESDTGGRLNIRNRACGKVAHVRSCAAAATWPSLMAVALCGGVPNRNLAPVWGSRAERACLPSCLPLATGRRASEKKNFPHTSSHSTYIYRRALRRARLSAARGGRRRPRERRGRSAAGFIREDTWTVRCFCFYVSCGV